MKMPIVLLILSSCFYVSSAANEKVTVDDIIDGDTIKVHRNKKDKPFKIRLACIDTPELSQSWGNEAKKGLSKLIKTGDVVTLKGTSNDRYKRVLAEIYTKDGTNVNLKMIQLGLAMTYYLDKNSYCKKNKDNYLHHENDARTSKRNIWSDEKFIPPWEYRKIKRNKNKIDL